MIATSKLAGAAGAGPIGISGLWRSDSHLAPLAQLLPSIRLLSLDVFDTLLWRTCERPEAVFLKVGRRAAQLEILGRGIGPEEFASLRQECQRYLYSTLGREPTLEDIYGHLPSTVGPAKQLLRLEEEVELEACVLNPSVASLVAECRDLQIPVALLSDMYLGEHRVRRLLAEAGFDSNVWTDRVLVSVDCDGYKSTGALFNSLIRAYPDIDPGAIVHIGDNPHSDVKSARAGGLRALHYDTVHYDPDGVLAVERIVCGPLFPEIDYARRLAGSLNQDLSTSAQPWHRIGAMVVGPFVSALVDWAVDHCEEAGIGLVAPLMREAHLLAPLLRRGAEARGLELEVVPLCVSRQAVMLAGARDTKEDLIACLLNNRRLMPVAALFEMVGLDTPRELRGYLDIDISSAPSVELSPGITVRDAVISSLLTDEAQQHLAAVVAEARARIIDYVDQVCGRHRRVATLDIGFFGHIQQSLERAFNGAGRRLGAVHLLGFGHGPVRDAVLSGVDIRTFAGSYGTCGSAVKTIHRSAPVLEQLLQGPSGSTVGYIRQPDGRVVPDLERNPLDVAELAMKATVQTGVMRFHDIWLELRRERPSLVAAIVARSDAWRAVAHRLIDSPSHVEADLIGSLHDDVNFGSRAVLPFCPPDIQSSVSWIGADRALLRGTTGLPVVWPQGVLARSDPGSVVERHAAASDDTYFSVAFGLARRLRARGHLRVVGYGTGEVAEAFIAAARGVGIAVIALVDGNAALHGSRRSGVEVISLRDAMALGTHTYVVLSLAHASAIAAKIRAQYQSEPVKALIVDLLDRP